MSTVKIHIDGIEYSVNAHQNLLEACISAGIDLPYFCYHPAMGSVGACRQCAVKKYANAADNRGRIIMSCMEPVIEGMIVSVNDPEAKEFRASVIEGLMTNHPHDCPVCDEGGECHLQDVTVMTGHNYRRFSFKKRTHANQNLGPFIHHEMNRCIQCYRCVRFYRDYAGGKDLNVFSTASRVYFGRQKDGILESEFSGNLVEVCPTGVFTDKTLKQHYTRKWDLTHAPSVCVHCSLGCNTIVGERYGSVRRIMNRYNSEINDYFLCDRGRFGYEFIHNPARIRTIMVKQNGSGFKEADDTLLTATFSGSLLTGKIIGIGSPRASLESNFALQELAGRENFFNGISAKEHELLQSSLAILSSDKVKVVSLSEIKNSDAVVILGEDVTQTAPVMALSIRQTVRNKPIAVAGEMKIPKWNDAAVREIAVEKTPLFIASPYSTKLDELATGIFYGSPADIARLGFAIADAIEPGLNSTNTHNKNISELSESIARTIINAEHPVIVAGSSLVNLSILHSLQNIIQALSKRGRKTGVSLVFNECNSVGMGMMKAEPIESAFRAIENSSDVTLVVLENDLYRRLPAEHLNMALSRCKKIIAIDHLMNPTLQKADIILPTATFAESSGTIVNNEGRAQRYYPVKTPDHPARESWDWIRLLMKASGNNNIAWKNFDSIVNALADHYPDFEGIRQRLPNEEFRFYNEKIARQTLRFSGRTAINAADSISEPAPPADNNTPLTYSMEGYNGKPPASLIPYYWTPSWNSVQAVNTYLEQPNGPLKDSDPGVKLFTDNSGFLLKYHTPVPESFVERDQHLTIIPCPRIFGSEELSAKARSVSELINGPVILLNDNEFKKIKTSDTGHYRLHIASSFISVSIAVDRNVPEGMACLFYAGEGPFIELPSSGEIITDNT